MLALPVPLVIAVAPSWAFIVAANVLLGLNQGLTWSMTVVMKVDLVGPDRRGLALGLNEAAGYGGVAVAAAASGLLAAEFAARDVLVIAGFGVAVTALALSVLGFATTSVPLSTILPQGLPGCALLVSPDLLGLHIPTAGSVPTQLAIPNTVILAGQVFHQQVVPVELGLLGNITALTSTNALTLTIGSF